MKNDSIISEDQYDKALDRADELFDATSGTREGTELESLLLAINVYEDKHHPVLSSDLDDAIIK